MALVLPEHGPVDPGMLGSWAYERGIAHVLDQPVRDGWLADRYELLAVFLRSFMFRTHELTVLDVLTEEPRHRDPRLDEARRALVDRLEQEAARVARGRAHEVEAHLDRPRSPRGPEADAILGPLAELRATLRTRIAPLHPEDLPAHRLRFSLGTRAPHAVFEIDDPRAWGRTRVRIAFELHAPLRAECSDHGGACAHKLMAVDALLRHLTRDPPPKELTTLLGLADTPGWARALADLEARGAQAALPTDTELSWWVRTPMSSGDAPVMAVVKKRGKRGEWLTPRSVRAHTLISSGPPLADADRRIAQLLALVEQSGRAWDAGRLVIEALVGHPRVLTGRTVESAQPCAVEVEDARVHVTRAREGLRLALVVRDHAIPPGTDIDVLYDEGAARLVVARVTPAVRTSYERLAEAITKLPAADLPAFAARLALLDPALGIDAEDLVPVIEVEARTGWTLRLASRDDGGLEAALLVRPLEDGPQYRGGEPPARAIAPLGPDRLIAALRDLVVERAAVIQRWTAWGAGDGDKPSRLFMGQAEVLPFLAALRADARGVEVEWTTKPIKVLPRLRARQLRIELASGPDWFAVEGEAQVEDHRATLAMLLDAARTKSDFVRLADDTWVEMERSVAERMRALEPHVRRVRGRSEIGALSVPAVAAALGDVPPPPGWTDIVRRAHEAQDTVIAVPSTLQASLRPYQVEGFVWMSRLAAWGAGAVLADDMGLGKTVQTIAVLLARAGMGPALVIAPTSVTHNWRRELARFAPSLAVQALRGADGQVALDGLRAGDVLITSYGLATIEQEALSHGRFATLVLDEAQVIKNPSAQRSQAVRALRAEWRLALTGTPIENHLGDLWAIFAAVAPGLLGSWEAFRDRWVGVPGEQLDGLRRLVRPFILRRTKADVLTELPPKTEVVVDVELSAPERKLYDDARLAATAELRGLGEDLGAAHNRFHVLAALTRLRQLACDASLVVSGDAPPSSKLARFAELAAALVEEGHSAIAFSQFVRLLDRAEDALRAREVPFLRLDGSTPSEQRGTLIDRFQSGGPTVLLVSLRAGGTGLNLTAADHVFHLDPWWNPAVEDQATDRAHRIGQAKPVTVFRMVARDTVESAILSLHAQKRDLAAQVLDGGEAGAVVSAEDLLAMITAGGAALEAPDLGPLADDADPKTWPAVPPGRGGSAKRKRKTART